MSNSARVETPSPQPTQHSGAVSSSPSVAHNTSPIDEFIIDLSRCDDVFDSYTQPRSLAALAQRDNRREQQYLQQQAQQHTPDANVDASQHRNVNNENEESNRRNDDRQRGKRASTKPTNAIDISSAMIVNEKVTNSSNVRPTSPTNQFSAKVNVKKSTASASTEQKSTIKTKSKSTNDTEIKMEKSKNLNASVLSANNDRSEANKKHKSGFLSRFAGFRFSLRGNKKKLKSVDNNVTSDNESDAVKSKKNIVLVAKSATLDSSSGGHTAFIRSRGTGGIRGDCQRSSMRSNDFVYIPLKDPPSKSAFSDSNTQNAVHQQQQQQNQRQSAATSQQQQQQQQQSNNRIVAQQQQRISPLQEEKKQHVPTGKPPLPRQPPRVVGVCAKSNPSRNSDAVRLAHQERASSAPREIQPSDVRRHNGYGDSDDVDFYFNQLRADKRLNRNGNGTGMTSAVSTEGFLADGNHDDSTFTDDSFFDDGGDDDGKIGLIETNLDTNETIISGKTRSLMELGPQQLAAVNRLSSGVARRLNRTIGSNGTNENCIEPRRPHKSMEFLLDKENQRFVLVSFSFY